MPSRIGLMLDMSARQLERVIYYEDYIVIDPGKTALTKGQLLNEVEYREAQEQYGEDFVAGHGRGGHQKTSRRNRPQQAQQRAGEGDGRDQEQADSQETGEASQAGAGFIKFTRESRLVILDVLLHSAGSGARSCAEGGDLRPAILTIFIGRYQSQQSASRICSS